MGLKIVANKECREKTRSPEMLSIPWGGGGGREGMGAKLEAKPFSLPSVMSRKISRRLANIRNVLYIVWRSIIQVLRVKRLRARDISFVDKNRLSLHLNQLFYSAKTHLVFCFMKGLGVW